MKNLYAFLLLLSVMAYGQNADPNMIDITVDGTAYTLQLAQPRSTPVGPATVTTFGINYTLPANHTFAIAGPNGSSSVYSGPGNVTIDLGQNLVGNQVTIQELNNGAVIAGRVWQFTATHGTQGNGDANPRGIQTPPATASTFDAMISAWPTQNYTQLTKTPFGYVDENQYIHIFLDYRGNNLGTTIPQGISHAQYIVHLLSPGSNDPLAPVFTIKQTSGSFSDALNFRNSNAKEIALHSLLDDGSIRDSQFLLSTSTTDITFEVIAVTGTNSTIKRSTIETYTIKMTPTYHGSFDVGFLKSELANPTYTLVNTPDGIAQTVKVTDNGKSQGVTTLMATFYYSPIIILEDLLGYKVPFYKLNGRNFLDDHKIYERIYPTVGVGLKDKVFENLYFGLNWEIVRGLGIFYGWNYRKVNTFNMPGFEQGTTTVTQDQFDYYTNTDWKIKPAYGIKLDLLVVLGLLGTK